MGQILTSVWYASEERAKNAFKLFVYDDVGALEIEPDEINFVGRNQTLKIRDVRNISLVRQTWNWIVYLLVNILLLPVYFVLYWFLNPILGVEVGTIIVVVVTVNLLGLLIGFSTKWVQIEHGDSQNTFSRSYFADGSRRGWSGVFGGTGKLYKLLRYPLEK